MMHGTDLKVQRRISKTGCCKNYEGINQKFHAYMNSGATCLLQETAEMHASLEILQKSLTNLNSYCC